MPSIKAVHFYLILAASWLIPALLSSAALASEKIIAIPIVDNNDRRQEHNYELFQIALDASQDKFGPYKLQRAKHFMENQRLLEELVKGDKLTVGTSMYRAEWADKIIYIPFPTLKGLASYRLFLTLPKHQQALSKVNSLDDLKKFKVGQGYGWSTNRILNDHGFKTITSDSYSGLFRMLNAERFPLFMRGVYEILPELETFSHLAPQMEVAKGIAVYTYLPLYFNVTKKQPRLAKRLEYGLHKVFESGEADSLFYRHYQTSIDLLNSDSRKVFHVDNTNLPDDFYTRDKKYLLDINNVETTRSKTRSAPGTIGI
ncbi:hypothetical protein [Teredinibacter franksiae]|uniref:hypothetical protein n=1 Tax=Teredinibacter franksiae TaxID=2761453 RepID=UPI0016231B77|nr:hypothetical protein [Teredinibacter franksiae]